MEEKDMKRTYITPLTKRNSLDINEMLAGSFDGIYGYEDENFLSDHGGGEWAGYTPSGTINWRGGDTWIDPDEMFSKGFTFGTLWETGWELDF